VKRAGQTSFFYLLLALGCLDRARRVRHSATLRSIARDYMSKATKVTSKPQLSPPASALQYTPTYGAFEVARMQPGPPTL
jgi:hypothetical protein